MKWFLVVQQKLLNCKFGNQTIMSSQLRPGYKYLSISTLHVVKNNLFLNLPWYKIVIHADSDQSTWITIFYHDTYINTFLRISSSLLSKIFILISVKKKAVISGIEKRQKFLIMSFSGLSSNQILALSVHIIIWRDYRSRDLHWIWVTALLQLHW